MAGRRQVTGCNSNKKLFFFSTSRPPLVGAKDLKKIHQKIFLKKKNFFFDFFDPRPPVGGGARGRGKMLVFFSFLAKKTIAFFFLTPRPPAGRGSKKKSKKNFLKKKFFSDFLTLDLPPRGGARGREKMLFLAFLFCF